MTDRKIRGCPCAHPYAYPRPYPYHGAYNQEQVGDQNVVTSVYGSPGANVNGTDDWVDFKGIYYRVISGYGKYYYHS
ncbi:MAG: hypothetical protein WA323_03920 [Candidatus Nitrosopolaris sp.]